MCIPSKSLCRVELRRPEVKIFRNSRFRPDQRNARLSAVPSAILLSLVRKSPLRNDVRKITDDSILSLNAGFSLEIPTGPSLEMFYFWPEIKIFRNGWVRAVRAVGRPVCHWDLCAKNPKNRFSLWTPVSHPESIRDLPWTCSTKTRSPDIQKRRVTGRPRHRRPARSP